jgi:hypothetical protein
LTNHVFQRKPWRNVKPKTDNTSPQEGPPDPGDAVTAGVLAQPFTKE